ncbi:MAG TPA: glutamate--tRNA ligase [Actinomycetota bacterium]|nr:glutamate--tRNA ligase [Actinomycetota bacterium]
MADQVRTRIAPAPSGSIHVGNARSALYSWLFARRHGGVFVLRVEDTDAKRATDEAYRGVMQDLRWLGLEWDEGPEVGGPFGPYRQSERFDRYREVGGRLLEAGHAYRCYCTQEELEQRRAQARASGRPPGYDGRCRHLAPEEKAAFEREGRAFAVRFAVPEGRTVGFDDMVRGPLTTSTQQIPDFVIQRSDGSPTYLLAAGVDDADMNITHVIRGEDLIPATPRQLLLREAMRIEEAPRFAHLPLLVDERGRPLSKRWGDVAVSAYRERGFLPQAMVNYLALLGWSYDDHTNIFSVEELIERFSLERVGRNPAAFDVAKLEWLNGHYIRQMSDEELAAAIIEACESKGLPVEPPEERAKLAAVAPLLRDRLRRLDEAPAMVRFLLAIPVPDDKARRAIEGQTAYLAEVVERLERVRPWEASGIEAALREVAEERGLKPKQAFQPIRAAVTGTLVSPPLFESLEILGREASLERLRAAAGGPQPTG